MRTSIVIVVAAVVILIVALTLLIIFTGGMENFMRMFGIWSEGTVTQAQLEQAKNMCLSRCNSACLIDNKNPRPVDWDKQVLNTKKTCQELVGSCTCQSGG